MTTHSSVLTWRIHGQRSLADYSPGGHKDSDMTEVSGHTHTHTVLLCSDTTTSFYSSLLPGLTPSSLPRLNWDFYLLKEAFHGVPRGIYLTSYSSGPPALLLVTFSRDSIYAECVHLLSTVFPVPCSDLLHKNDLLFHESILPIILITSFTKLGFKVLYIVNFHLIFKVYNSMKK